MNAASVGRRIAARRTITTPHQVKVDCIAVKATLLNGNQ